jgi:3-(3-hydroxy-phenyl)propionate hydroxylase
MGMSDAAQLDLYDLQRRTVTMEAVQVQTIQNKKDMESADENDQAQFRNRLRNIMRDPEKNRAYLQRISMIESLQRAAKIS